MAPSSRWLLLVAGLLTWAIAFSELWSSGVGSAGLLAALGFAFGFVWTVLSASAAAPARSVVLLLQTACALLALLVTGNRSAGLLLVVVSAELPLVVRGRWPFGWLLAQFGLAALLLVRARGLHPGLGAALSQTSFGLFAFAVGTLTRRETDARTALACAQAQLSENARDAERLRISRELHDTLGHHLTALNLELELAQHAPRTASAEAIGRAQTLTRALLSEVREVVSELRQAGTEQLSTSLARLAAERSHPKIHLELCSSVPRLSSEATLALFRCAQEAVTNASKHGRASNVWLRLEASGELVALEVRDDGRGTSGIQHGNGLRGLQERLHPLGGTLRVISSRGAGTQLRAELPESA